MNKSVGRPRKQTDTRKNRKLTLSDDVFEGLKVMGNGSASQAVTDLYLQQIALAPTSATPKTE